MVESKVDAPLDAVRVQTSEFELVAVREVKASRSWIVTRLRCTRTTPLTSWSAVFERCRVQRRSFGRESGFTVGPVSGIDMGFLQHAQTKAAESSLRPVVIVCHLSASRLYCALHRPDQTVTMMVA